METLLHVGLSNAVSAAAMAVVVACVGRVCRRPALVHSLWLLVLLKLLTPPILPVEVAWPDVSEPAARLLSVPCPNELPVPALETSVLASSDGAPVPASAEAAALSEAAPAAPGGAAKAFAAGTAHKPVPEAVTQPAVPSLLTALRLPNWKLVVIDLWVAGTVVWLGLAAMRILRFGCLLRHARPAPAELQEQADRLAAGFGLRGSPGVWLVPGCISPLLWALGGSPRLLVPVGLWERLEEDQKAALLVHELAHLRRRDHWVRTLELLVTGLYWWHPVVWWARGAIREAEEQCCDAWVVWALPASAKAYANALLQTLDYLSEARPAVPMAASGVGHLSCLKRRLTMIMQETTPRALSWTGRLAVFTWAALLLPVAPTWAQQRRTPVPDEPRREAGRDDDDAPRAQGREGQKSEAERDRRPELKEREAQLDQARGEFERLTKQFEEQRSKMEAQLQEARARIERQMREAERPLREMQERLAEAHRRVVELERANRRPGEGPGRGEGAAGLAHPHPPVPGGHEPFGRFPGMGRGSAGAMAGPHPPAPPAVPGGPGPFGGMMQPMLPMAGFGGAAPATERRLEELEKKLDRLLDEVAKLKEERRAQPDRGLPR